MNICRKCFLGIKKNKYTGFEIGTCQDLDLIARSSVSLEQEGNEVGSVDHRGHCMSLTGLRLLL